MHEHHAFVESSHNKFLFTDFYLPGNFCGSKSFSVFPISFLVFKLRLLAQWVLICSLKFWSFIAFPLQKQQELNKTKEVIVLDHKRSNAINIAITKLPPARAIKAAILKMDATVITREGIEKLLNMLPTEEERGKIQEAQMLSPELPLGSAESFLLTLSSISELSARLKLWAFKLDFENIEKEIAEPLMDLKLVRKINFSELVERKEIYFLCRASSYWKRISRSSAFSRTFSPSVAS